MTMTFRLHAIVHRMCNRGLFHGPVQFRRFQNVCWKTYGKSSISTDAVAEPGKVLNHLIEVVELEFRSGLSNVFEDKRFSDVLVEHLDVLSRSLPSNSNVIHNIKSAKDLSVQYVYMCPEERGWMLQDFKRMFIDLNQSICAYVESSEGDGKPTNNGNDAAFNATSPSSAGVLPHSPDKATNLSYSKTYQDRNGHKRFSKSENKVPDYSFRSNLTWEEQMKKGFTRPESCSCWVPIIFDLETTGMSLHGLNVETSLPVEIAAMNPLNNETYSTLIKLPEGILMSPKAEQITQITSEMLQDESLPDFEMAYCGFLKFIENQVSAVESSNALPVLIGHNIKRFDLKILLNRAKEKNLSFPLDSAILDTYLTAHQLLQSVDGLQFNLVKLLLYFGEKPLEAHRALKDVQMTWLLLNKLLGISGIKTMKEVEKFFNRPSLPSAFHSGFVGHLLPWEQGKKGILVKRADFSRGITVPVRMMNETVLKKENKKHLQISSNAINDSVDEAEFSVETWAADDPLSLIDDAEEDAYISKRAFPNNENGSVFGQETSPWAQIFSNDNEAESFLSLPVGKLPGKKKFTSHQLRDLRAAGLLKLKDILQQWPKAYLPMRPGLLPDRDNLEEQSVCLLVTVQNPERDLQTTFTRSGWAILTGILTILSEETNNASYSTVSPDNSGTRAPKLAIKVFRKGHGAKSVILKMEQELRSFGSTLGVSGRVVVDKDSDRDDCWLLKDGSFKFMPADEYLNLLSEGSTQFQPVYSQKANVQSQRIAALVTKALSIVSSSRSRWEDPIPGYIRQKYELINYLEAVEGMHMPCSPENYERCRQTLAFKELFELQLRVLIQRKILRSHSVGSNGQRCVIPASGSLLGSQAESSLPFQLTQAQKKALTHIRKEMSVPYPMMSLLQGDVGCGKTAVAMIAAMDVVSYGFQVAIMAPTEILAEQHFKSFSRLVSDIKDRYDIPLFNDDQTNEDSGKNASFRKSVWADPSVELLTGSTPRVERMSLLQRLRDGSLSILIGTHALITDGVDFNKLGMAIIDEQHKFGVQQRAKLLSKAVPSPHILYMSATPIPRSLALAHYGTQKLITIDELPPGRNDVATQIMIDSHHTRSIVNRKIQEEVHSGGQVFIVCPLIEAGSGDIKAAIQERDRLIQEGVVDIKDCQVLHGKMISKEKEIIMSAFASGKAPVLISTTVVEVGIDVPEASLIIVEHANLFGLAQLHQLRGRVGRGSRPSTCILISDNENEEVDRLKVLERSSSGFEVAEADFLWRGGGDLFGKRQSGKDNNDSAIQICRFPEDTPVLEKAREAASLHLSKEVNPFDWPNELLASIMEAGPLELDIADIP